MGPCSPIFYLPFVQVIRSSAKLLSIDDDALAALIELRTNAASVTILKPSLQRREFRLVGTARLDTPAAVAAAASSSSAAHSKGRTADRGGRGGGWASAYERSRARPGPGAGAGGQGVAPAGSQPGYGVEGVSVSAESWVRLCCPEEKSEEKRVQSIWEQLLLQSGASVDSGECVVRSLAVLCVRACACVRVCACVCRVAR